MSFSSATIPEFFRTWFGSQPGWLVIWCKKAGSTAFRCEAFSGPDWAENAACYAADMDKAGFDVYFGLCPLGFRPPKGKRGKAEDTCSMPGLWVEIDIQGPGHASPDLCPDLAAALDLVARFPYQPAIVIHSGGGVHCYWPANPIPLNDGADREKSRQLTDRFQEFFRRATVNPQGYKVDSTADLARVLRVPGTHNRKQDPPRRVTFLEFDSQVRYSLDELEGAIGEAAPTGAPPALQAPPQPGLALSSKERPSPLDRARAYMDKVPGAGEGGRNSKAHQLSCKLQNDFALGANEDAYRLLESWNQKNSPPLGDQELQTCWNSAAKSAKGPTGAALDEPQARAQPGSLEVVLRQLSESGKLSDAQAKTAAPKAGGEVIIPALRPKALEVLRLHASTVEDLGYQLRDIEQEEAEREASRSDRPGVHEVKTARLELADYQKGRLYKMSLPIVAVKEFPPQVILRSVVEVFQESNSSKPRFFAGPGGLSFLDLESQNPEMITLAPAGLQARLGGVANWVRVTYNKESETERLSCVDFPKHIAEQLLQLSAEELGVPRVTRLGRTPIYSSAGKLLAKTGFYPECSLALHIPPGLSLPEVSARPTPAEVGTARTLLVTQLLGDFPFVAESDRANALALLLSLFIRELTGLTPLTMVEASTPRTGKTLLAEVLLAVFCGLGPAGDLPPEVFKISELGAKDEEANKILCSILMSGPSVVFLDNISRKVDCPPLAMTLTSSNPSFRVLGASRMVTLANSAIWMGTANNPTYSNENSRRVVTVRLDAGLERPEERQGYQIPDIIGWATENRPRLIWAALTLVQNWIAQGKPPGSVTLGGFQRWASTLGGILDCAGVPGFMENRHEVLARSDPDSQEWAAFFSAWWEDYGGARVSTMDLIQVVRRINAPAPIFRANTDQSQLTALGMALNKRAGRIFSGLKLEACGHVQGRKQYQLRPNTADVENALRSEVGFQPPPTPRLSLVAQEQMLAEVSEALESFEL